MLGLGLGLGSGLGLGLGLGSGLELAGLDPQLGALGMVALLVLLRLGLPLLLLLGAQRLPRPAHLDCRVRVRVRDGD